MYGSRWIATGVACCAALLCTLPCAGQTDTVFVFDLSGSQEVPAVQTDASGVAVGVLNAAQDEFTIMVKHDVAGATASHIHGPAASGTNAGVLLDLGDPASPIAVTWTGMTQAEVDDLLAGNYYVNVHTPANPGGEIRGQIVDDGQDRTYSFPIEGAQEVPPVSTTATGTGEGSLNGARTAFSITVTHDVPDVSASHIHGPAPMGENAGVVLPFPDPASPITFTWEDMTPAQVFDLVAGYNYVNVHSPSYPGGEIRGQIVNAAADPAPKAIPGCGTSSSARPAGLAGDIALVLLLCAALCPALRRKTARV